MRAHTHILEVTFAHVHSRHVEHAAVPLWMRIQVAIRIGMDQGCYLQLIFANLLIGSPQRLPYSDEQVGKDGVSYVAVCCSVLQCVAVCCSVTLTAAILQ